MRQQGYPQRWPSAMVIPLSQQEKTWGREMPSLAFSESYWFQSTALRLPHSPALCRGTTSTHVAFSLTFRPSWRKCWLLQGWKVKSLPSEQVSQDRWGYPHLSCSKHLLLIKTFIKLYNYLYRCWCLHLTRRKHVWFFRELTLQHLKQLINAKWGEEGL
jgi:hypothetical protein